MKVLIIGLGNPGEKYQLTRHNIGFLVIDQLISRISIQKRHQRHNCFLYNGTYNEKSLILGKPLTYMNRSGDAVKSLLNDYKETSLIVIGDDYYLPYGEVRLRQKGSAGGHNGFESILEVVRNDFIRLRCGVGDATSETPMKTYVLEEFSLYQKTHLDRYTSQIAGCILSVLREGLQQASTRYNKRNLIDL